MFDGVVSLGLINGFATNRTKPNMNPPMAVPYITEANTQTQLSVTLGASFHCCSFSATVAHWSTGVSDVSAARATCRASGLGCCDRCHRLLFEYPIIFWTLRYRR